MTRLPTALIVVACTQLAWAQPSGVHVTMPASGVVIDALPPLAARWEVEGTLVVGARDAKPVDRLLGSNDQGTRLITVEVRRESCGAPPPPGSTSPWPTLGYAGIRTPLPERRGIKSCKQPDLMLELRFPAGVDTEPDALLAEADRWEPLVVALHAAYGTTRIALDEATRDRAKVVYEAAPEAPDALAALSTPLTLMSGLAIERRDEGPWLVRSLGGHDVLMLIAPTGAGLALQILPFGLRYDCKLALDAALKSHPPAAGNPVQAPPGWLTARAIGTDRAAFCVEGKRGGIIAIGGARLPREQWLPVATPMLTRLGLEAVK